MSKNIAGLEGYSIEHLETVIAQHLLYLREHFAFEDLDMTIMHLQLFGSRLINDKSHFIGLGSDLDVYIEYQGKAREDDVHSSLNHKENLLYIEGIQVDFFPVRIPERIDT